MGESEHGDLSVLYREKMQDIYAGRKYILGLLKNYFNQTRKPEGKLGKLMISGMNSGHAKLTDWGFAQLPELPVNKAVDLGCGGGRSVSRLLEKFPESHVTGVDYSPLSVEKAREYNRDKIDEGRCTVLTGDVSSLDLPKETFDLAMAFETIYFWPGLDRCFAQVAGILKQGGYFMICNESDGADAFSLKYEKIIDGMKVYTASEIEAALKKAGFSEIRVNHHYSRPWIAILAKK